VTSASGVKLPLDINNAWYAKKTTVQLNLKMSMLTTKCDQSGHTVLPHSSRRIWEATVKTCSKILTEAVTFENDWLFPV